jgi:hypothetical protein
MKLTTNPTTQPTEMSSTPLTERMTTSIADGDVVVSNTYSTTDYAKFSMVKGNRMVSRRKVIKLREAIKLNDLTLAYPIVVDRKFRIMDGQHRYIACVELKKPIYYIVIGEFDIRVIADVNNNQSRWTAYDYLNAYCELGIHEYKVFAGFMTRNEFNFSVTFIALTGRWGGEIYSEFRRGNFKVRNLEKSDEVADRVHSLKEHLTFYKQREFVLALTKCMEHPDYDHPRMLKKMATTGGSSLRKATNAADYIRQLEDVYNWHVQTENKVRFF